MNLRILKWLGLIAVATSLPILGGCKTGATRTEQTSAHSIPFGRRIASGDVPISATPPSTAFSKRLAQIHLQSYSANLHAHHFMDVHGSKKNPLSLSDVLTPGVCRAEHGSFPMDDGRPCRDENGEENATILPRTKLLDDSPDLTDYFRQACEYATHEGELDIFFTTPHTKNNGEDENQIVTSTTGAELLKRKGMLASMNPNRLENPKFICGLGQEASSISSGNHVNIFGQFHADGKDEKPLFFQTGDFKALYSEIKSRNDAGGNVFLQLNHPGVKADLYWGTLSELLSNKKRRKEALNDYGLDDFAPVGCLLGKIAMDAPECKDVVATNALTPDQLRQTYANIRAASGDPFRLIEVIPPGVAKEGGDDTDGDGKADTGDTAFGATTNTKTNFRAVHHRTDANTYEDGVYDWVFYLSMGFKLGPTANQDNHHMNWGNATASRTGVLAPNLKEASVLEALASRHVFASEDRNTKIFLTQTSGKIRKIMGDSAKIATSSTLIQIGYSDPDAEDTAAKVRLYYYRENDPLDFGFRAPAKAVYHTVSFSTDRKITLPEPSAEDRSANDLISIKNGEVLSLQLPLVRGNQWIFAEVIQDHDFDKIWSAPIWIQRK